MQVLVMTFFPKIPTPLPDLRWIANSFTTSNGIQDLNALWWLDLWYIKADLCLYFLSPFLLFPLHRYGYKVFPVIITLAVLSAYYNFINPDLKYTFQSRAGCWLAGFIIGYILTREKLSTNKKYSNLFITLLILASISIPYFQIKIEIEYLETSKNLMLVRIASPVVIGCFLFLLLEGYLPKLAELLNHDLLKFLCKLSYSAYVVHTRIYEIFNNSLKMPVYVSTAEVIKQIISVLVLAFIVALPWCLLFEYPFIHLQRLLFGSKGMFCSKIQMTGNGIRKILLKFVLFTKSLSNGKQNIDRIV